MTFTPSTSFQPTSLPVLTLFYTLVRTPNDILHFLSSFLCSCYYCRDNYNIYPWSHYPQFKNILPGASTLDPDMCGRYKLSVMVRDMAGKANAFFSSGIVTVEVTGNAWASPDPVRLQENLPGPYPIPISQVRRHKPNNHRCLFCFDSEPCHLVYEGPAALVVYTSTVVANVSAGVCQSVLHWGDIVDMENFSDKTPI